MRRGLVMAAAVTAAAVLALGGVTARTLSSRGSNAGSASGTRMPPATAEVTRTTLVETKTVPGTLGYGDPVPVDAAGQGTLTWIAAIGSVVNRGEPLFKLDQRPVVALYGTLPLYRTLSVGLAGADVKQLEENLSALGYTGFAVDNTFTAGTAAAVRLWQTSLELAVTGTVEQRQVVVTPGPVRVTGLLLGVGAVALLIGGIGVANTMVISVLERRSEIGLRRALGATRGQIRIQFLAESLLLTALGGGAGVLLGSGVTAAYASLQGWPTVVPAWFMGGAVTAALLIGALAGLYPAIRAARLAPTEALATT
jgi:peptidoglycan hydrolase-like protein with peptidoglycan-binding domain